MSSSAPLSAPAIDLRRATYLAELAQGTERLQASRRESCPWCGGQRLRVRLTAPDVIQRKPGTFTLEECEDCAHVFQNPGLTPEGAAFYHRDRDLYERPPSRRRHRERIRAMLHIPEPESWLDVGTGDADFPATAREFFPYTSFDGTDPTPRVLRARATERVEEAYVGHLITPGLPARLRGRYDVVSVFHQFELSPSPREELRAAIAALRPGGHLVLELTDPRSAFAALLGKWWPGQAQPRQIHLLPLPNVHQALESHNCTILTTDACAPHTPTDLATATTRALSHVIPAPDTPWRTTRPTVLQHTTRAVLTAATAPLRLAATAADHTLAPLIRRSSFSNAYRVIARKNPLRQTGEPGPAAVR
ncbi:class I SAM-dependent methyltransferase [Streptomyces chromofuscus]|uniref:Class I SAM-dependent methyltransferase n=1 Tax=Streptomyces chromofuscus TaxID=42881 RepID=A0A7M2TE95_STRCW|nr:class I SAM-dependent methyltransferase [Streptomyces chromofuscus]QOV46245.1 class I SAM-dependent methyltransferase [Streptomyces chromofuscus]GGS96107.1 methyltransferase type 12 [Streptomyces chromofuscus]